MKNQWQVSTNVHLLTDGRLQHATAIIRRLLVAAGENPDGWVVRVLDTTPPTINAFVVGGRYVYIYAGLMDFAASDDELAFIVGHELGHTLLLHQVRRSQDITTTIANIAVLVGKFWERNRQALNTAGKGMAASYSRLDEEEADAIGAAIVRRAGYDPIHGAGFFSRMKEKTDKTAQANTVEMAQFRGQVDQLKAACVQNQQLYGLPQYRTPENYQTVMVTCQNAQSLALQYNQTAQAYNTQEVMEPILRTHPADGDRVVTIAAVSDFLAGRRELETLKGHQQSYRVMVALRTVDSALIRP